MRKRKGMKEKRFKIKEEWNMNKWEILEEF